MTIRLNRLRWFGHVQRMEENRFQKCIIYMNLEATRLKGRPRNRRQDEVREDGRLVGGKWWKERVNNREEWKKLLRMARNHRILHMPMEWMNDMRASSIPDTFDIYLPFFETNKPLKNLKPDSLLYHLINFLCSPSDTLWIFNHLKTKRRPLYLKTQSVLHSKHFSSQL